MPSVTVNDVTLYYETLGEGTPIIMIMGYGSSAESQYRFPAFVEALSRRHHVILFDNRGTGRSDKPDNEYSIKVMADDTYGLMAALGVPQAHVLGFSMGGMIAQELALNYPQTSLSLILCSTSCNGKQVLAEADPEFRNFVETAAAGRPPALPPEEFLRLFFKWVFTPSFVETNRDALIHAQKMMQYPTPLDTFTRQGQAIVQHDACDRLHEITIPTLVLHGDADILIPPTHATRLAEQIPHARLQLFRNAAHGFFAEVEEQTASTILTFLSTIDTNK